MKVIIADENEAYRTMIANTLRTQDHDPIILDSGGEVLTAYKKDEEISILFLDWNLPTIDGLELATKIRELNHHNDRDCYMIITGDRGGRYDIMNATEMGANDLLTKPYDRSTIMERLETAIDYFLKLPDEVEKSETDPVENLLDEHGILRFQAKKLEELIERVDQEAKNKLVDWLSGRSFVLETSIHQDKENEYSIAFMDRLIKSQSEVDQTLKESASKIIEEEHVKLERVVEEIKELFTSYKESLEKEPIASKDYNIMEHIGDFPAYCLKCKEKVIIVDPTIFQMETGNYSFKGECPDCGSGVTAIIGKSIGSSMKHIALKRTLKRYIKILREHLKREEELYFPLANRYLTMGDKTRLIEKFKDIEEKYGIKRMGKDFLLSSDS